MKLFIIIVSFNSGEDLTKLVERLGKEKVSGWELEIVVVENGQLAKNKVRIIYNKKNLGFAKGANIGIRYASEKDTNAVLLLNPDTVIEPGVIKTIVANKADIISPVIKFKRNDQWIYDHGGRIDWWLGRTNHLESSNLTMKQFNNEAIDYVSGCCMLIKRQVFETIGLFDERFFLYFEDVDFCIRAKKAGFKVAVEPKAVIIHNLTEGAKKPFSSQLELIKSNLKFINKYLGFTKPLGFLYCLVLSARLCINRLFQQ